MKVYTFADFNHCKDFPFFVQRTTVETETFERHGHSFSELVVVLGGSGTHVTETETYPIRRGDVFVLNGGTVHGFGNSNNLEVCNLMYDPTQLISPQQDLYTSSSYQALFILEPMYRKDYGFKGRLQLNETLLSSVVMLLNAMENEQRACLQGYQSILAAYFMQLVVLLSRYYSTSEERSAKSIVRLAKVINYLETNYQAPLNLDQLAKEANLSKNQFLRVFKKAFGTTPIDYLTKYRIQKATYLLNKSTDCVSHIAFEVGFTSSSYFSRQFRQITGKSPKEFRSSLIEVR